jgi:hypothetical protein
MTTVTFPTFDYMQRTQLLAYIKRNKWNYNISEPDDTLMSREQLKVIIDQGIEEFKQGKTTKLDVNDINSFLGL